MRNVIFILLVTAGLTGLSLPQASAFSGQGSGTSEADPYLITSLDELKEVNNYLNDPNVYFKLAGDVDISAETNWDPLGKWNNFFQGHFDGDNHTVSGLQISDRGDDAGFFGWIKNATVKNLTVATAGDGVNSTERAYCGILAGSAGGAGTTGDCTITNCTVRGKLNVNNDAGAFCGQANNLKLIDCRAENVSVTTNRWNCGGLIGIIRDNADRTTLVENCSLTNVNLKSNDNNAVGGVAGTIEGSSNTTITGCRINNLTIDLQPGKNGAGGIAGYCNGSTTVSNCTVSGFTLNNGNQCGGFIGLTDNTVSIIDSHVYDALFSNVEYNVAGFIGVSRGATSVSNSSAESTINAVNHVGGFYGWNNSAAATVNCRAYATITATQNARMVGGFVAANEGSGSLSGCLFAGSIVLNNLENSPADIKVGGFAGQNRMTLTNCAAIATIDNAATAEQVTGTGGFAGVTNDNGSSSGVINNSFFSGTIKGSGNIGGFIGYHNKSGSTVDFTNNYAHAVIEASAGDNIGGFIGYTADQSPAIVNAYFTGSIAAQGNNVATFAGLNAGNTTFTDCAAQTLNTIAPTAGVTALEAAALMTQAAYPAAWFTGDNPPLTISEGKTYPYFASQSAPAAITSMSANTLAGTLVNEAETLSILRNYLPLETLGEQDGLSWSVDFVETVNEGDDVKTLVYETNKTASYPVTQTRFIAGPGTVDPDANPVADPAAVVASGNMRFTVLTPELIRIEWSGQSLFEDRASFVVVNRNLPVPTFTTREENGYLFISTDKLELQYKTGTHPVNDDPCNPNLQITLQLNGEDIVWYPGKKDPYNLKGTTRTLDNAEGDVRTWLEDGLVSRLGWAVIDEKQPRNDGSLSLMFDGSEDVNWVAQRADQQSLDWYFLGYGHDYKQALGDFAKIAGKTPLPPLYVFGYWYSKYQRYSEQDFTNIVNDIQTNNIPLDVLVIDMDWHRNGKTGSTANTEWTGWSWNRDLFPDPAGFIAGLHARNLKTTLNLHPADGIFPLEDNYALLAADLGVTNNATIPWNIENKAFYRAFFNRILRPHENIGVDFWWLDWQQWMIANNEANLGNTFWLNHVFYSDKKLQGQGRPFIFHRWGGLGNHRYPIGFSGDTHATFPSLAFQPYFTATASNVGYGYWSHDIGGHQQSGDNDPELYLRWIQYGVFSPILRTHATNAANIERRIWQFPNFPLMREAIELRYSLIPYIYTYARYSYDTGISLCRPMYYDYPERDEAYRYEGQYMFGNDILAAPVVRSDKGTGSVDQTLWLPEGNWYEAATGEWLEGDRVVTRSFTREQIPYYYREGAIIPRYPKMSHLKARPDSLILQFVPGDAGEFLLYEDEEDNDNYAKGAYSFTRITQSKENAVTTYTIHPRQGTFAGMPEQRAYTLQLLGKAQPASVEFVGGQQGSYQYNAETKTITVHLPAQACNTALVVRVNE
jgi:hypothetical protein